MLRYLERHTVLARQFSDRGEFLAAAIQPKRGEVIAAEQATKFMADKAASCSATFQRMLHYLQVNSLPLRQEQHLSRGDGLTEPQQVDQVLGRVPGARTAQVGDPLRVGECLEQCAMTFKQGGISANK
jgi:hypothetical protein